MRTGAGLIRALARAVVRLFYHRVDIVGAERVPRSGPLVIVANHRNALIDPLILIATLPRALRPLAKAPLFRHPLLAPFLHLAGALPVHRRADPGSDPAQNAAMFRTVAASLRDGGAILLFPEGVSQAEPVLMPLRTGVARIVLGTEGQTGASPPTLLPVGLTFHEPGTFRTGWALVLVGTPVPVDEYLALAAHEPERAVRELTARVAEALRALIVEVQDRETLHLTEGLEAIRRAEAEDAAGAVRDRRVDGRAGGLDPGRPSAPTAGSSPARRPGWRSFGPRWSGTSPISRGWVCRPAWSAVGIRREWLAATR